MLQNEEQEITLYLNFTRSTNPWIQSCLLLVNNNPTNIKSVKSVHYCVQYLLVNIHRHTYMLCSLSDDHSHYYSTIVIVVLLLVSTFKMMINKRAPLSVVQICSSCTRTQLAKSLRRCIIEVHIFTLSVSASSGIIYVCTESTSVFSIQTVTRKLLNSAIC